jgi:GNAT superfamily N-acetyltransferase
MIELRAAETDAELELWRSVRIAILPNERTASIEELRSGGSFMLLAFQDGALAGSGSASTSDMGGGAVTPRVLREHRRQGVGTALLRRLASHAEECGHAEIGSMVDDPESFAFAQHFGFAEVGRQVEQVRAVRLGEPWPAVPDGIEIVTVAERPELLPRLYHELAVQAFDDMPTPRKVEITLEQWETEWLNWPEATFVALSGGEVVGMAGLNFDADQPDRAENTLTAVRRDWRGRRLARLLKETATAWASAHGIREIYTWTQTGNENMRAVNERLGFVTRSTSISVRRALPL